MTELDTPERDADGADREADAAGETVGEAKWTALRELERRFPGLDKSQVEFVVLAEGERGLLGVGFVPARVIARVVGPLPSVAAALPEPGPAAPLSGPGERLKELLEQVRDALGIEATVSVRESEGTLVGTFHGRELGLVIGKHGQTIDAIQYLAAAAAFRASDDERLEIVVDAAGYRDRRQATLEALADRTAARVATTGRPIELEPMSASERKIVHLRLKGRDDVVTASEGAEPNRFVVVRPSETIDRRPTSP
jgi:spoIIIJ-associated protein